MATLRVELAEELVAAAELDVGNLSQEAARLLALKLFHEERVSPGRAAELCQTPLAAFMDFAAAHGAPPLRYRIDDLEAEHRSVDQLGHRTPSNRA